jgi:hypothetical protein
VTSIDCCERVANLVLNKHSLCMNPESLKNFGYFAVFTLEIFPPKLSKKVAGEQKMAAVGKFNAASMAVIGRELRWMYADIIAEGVPERFAEILRRPDQSPKARKTSRHLDVRTN